MKRLLEHKMEGKPIPYNNLNNKLKIKMEQQEEKLEYEYNNDNGKHTFISSNIRIDVFNGRGNPDVVEEGISSEEIYGTNVFVLYRETENDSWKPVCRDVWSKDVIQQHMKMTNLMVDVEEKASELEKAEQTN